METQTVANELIDILRDSKLFAGFSEEQLEEVILHLSPQFVVVKSGDRIYKKGDVADRCWLIQSGKLMLKRASLRSPYRHMIYSKGSVTGISGLADPGSTRAVSMLADGKVRLVEITHEGISRLNQDAQLMLWRNVSRILIRKLSVCLSQESLNNED